MKIENIIFDLGGVILNINYQLTVAAFEQIGAQNFKSASTPERQKKLFEDFEIGKITADEFRTIVKTKYNLMITDEEFDYAWNAMLLDLPHERLDLIRLLKQKHNFRTFLFSNTNEIHLKSLRNRFGLGMFSGCFDKEYYSNECGQRKPNREAFQMVLEENQLKADKTLFIDDSMEHVQAAVQSGLCAKIITRDASLSQVIDEILKNF